MKSATYECEECKKVVTLRFTPEDRISLSIDCRHGCHAAMHRSFDKMETNIESESVSAAAQTMLWSNLPSGRQKAVS
jgi:hypothetical protein